MANEPILYDDNDPNSIIGYEVYCDGCDKLLGCTNDKLTNLTLCSTCTPECCTTETLEKVTDSKKYWSIIGHKQEAERLERAIFKSRLMRLKIALNSSDTNEVDRGLNNYEWIDLDEDLDVPW